MTILPFPPFISLLLGLVLATALLYGVFSLMRRDPEAPMWEGFTPGWVAIFVVLGVVWVGLFLLTLAAVFFGTWATILNPATATLGLGGLTAALLGAPFLIWGTVLKHQTVRWQKEGHMTDRISKAVEQLGAEKAVKKDGVEETRPNLEVRIGAILSLERIAQDSATHDKGRDHVRVMEILCAYIRENAPASSAQDHPYGEWEPLKDDPTDEEREAHMARRKERFGRMLFEGLVYKWAQTLPPVREDIALALKVIGRRTPAQFRVEAAWPASAKGHTIHPADTPCPRLPDEPGEAPLSADALEAYRNDLRVWKKALASYTGYRLDLRNTNLQRADIAEGDFRSAHFFGARMEGANLVQARIEGANLREVRMEGADFWLARMEGAYLWHTRMEGADLGDAQLDGADLVEARMEGAVLRCARLIGADLEDARMEGASLWWAQMDGAEFWRTRIDGANFAKARMGSAQLWEVRINAETDLSAATFHGAALRSIDFSQVEISQEQVNASFGDKSVILTDTLDWPDHWPEWELPEHHANGGPTYNSELAKWRADPANYTPPPPPETP